MSFLKKNDDNIKMTRIIAETTQDPQQRNYCLLKEKIPSIDDDIALVLTKKDVDTEQIRKQKEEEYKQLLNELTEDVPK